MSTYLSPLHLKSANAFETSPEDANSRKSLKSALEGRKIIVIGYGVNGFGDFLCAQKICRYLHDTLGVDLKEIALASNADKTQISIFALDGLTLIDATVESISRWKPHIQIFAPVVDDYVVTPRMDKDNKIPTITIAEYGFEKGLYSSPHKNLSAYAFGFKASEIGYIPTPSLRKWATYQEDLSPMDRLRPLFALPETLQKAMFQSTLSEDVMTRFAETHKLYFAYAKNNSEIYSFISAVGKMNAALNDKKHLTFFILGSALMSPAFIRKELPKTAAYPFEACFTTLQKCGFSSINFVDATVPEANRTLNLGSNGKKTITLLLSPLASHFVENLIMASEEETLVTGDQSFSECLSAEKFPVYEIFPHKVKLYQDFMALFPDELSSRLKIHGSKNAHSTSALNLDPSKLAELFIFRRKNTHFAKALKASIRQIARTYDFSEKFDNILIQAIRGISAEDSLKIEADVFVYPQDRLLSSHELPLNKFLYTSLENIGKLLIDFEGNSAHPGFENLKFETQLTTDGYQFIVSLKSTADETTAKEASNASQRAHSSNSLSEEFEQPACSLS